jgi:hypothetical protein
MGRAMIQERVFEKPGRLDVTMSVITPFGITVYASVTMARSVVRWVCGGSPPVGE